MARHRTHPVAFKRQIVQEYLPREVGLNTLAKRRELCRHLIRVWIAKYERRELDEEVEAAGDPPSKQRAPWLSSVRAGRCRMTQTRRTFTGRAQA